MYISIKQALTKWCELIGKKQIITVLVLNEDKQLINIAANRIVDKLF